MAAEAVRLNDSFERVTVRWEAPADGATGFWYRVSDDLSGEVTPATATYTTVAEVVLERAALKAAGTVYFDVVSVEGVTSAIGTVSNGVRIQINGAAPALTSQSHPDQNAWVAGTTLVMDFAPPAGLPEVRRYFYRVDRDSRAVYGDGAGWTEASGDTVILTEDHAGEALTHFTYYVHLAAEDVWGNVVAAVAHYRVQIGEEPAKTSLYGYVKDGAGEAIIGATVRLEPYGISATTETAGYFIFDNVYVGPYRAYVVGDADSFEVALDVAADVSPLDLTSTP